MASSEDDLLENASIADDDLFGSDDEVADNKVRELSDRELDSGDDEERSDRARAKSHSADVEDDPEKNSVILDAKVARHLVPKPLDGEVRTHVKIRHEAYREVVQYIAIAKVSWFRPAPV